MTGTITVLFTDLVGSTELLSGLGDDAADELRRAYFKILRDTVTRHSGREVKNLGDGIMAVFASAIDALHCAIDIQRTVQAHNREEDASLGVRIGLEVGEPIAEEEDYFGTPVVIAKRLCDSAQGGQIIVSELVSRLVGSRGRFDFKDIGLLSLRGIDEAIAAREVAWYPLAGSEPSGPEPDRVLQLDGTPRWGKKMGTTVEARRKPRLVPRFLAASMLLALAVIAVYAFVASRDDAAPGREPSESASEPGDGSSAPLSRLDWQRVADVNGSLGGAFDQGINRIEATGDQLVAVGHTQSAAGDLDGAVWISDDGAQWAEAPSSTEDPFSGPGDQEISGVRARGRGLIAVGRDGQGLGSSEDLAAAVWVSDGNDWQRVSHSELVFDGLGPQYMNRVVPYGGDGWVAIGATWESTPGSEVDGAVWTSVTGRSHWVIRQENDGTFAGPETQDIRSVTRNGNTLIAAGTDAAGGDFDGALWRSNGVVWSRVKAGEEVLGGAGDQQIITVEPHRRGFVAVGHDEGDGEGDAAVWLSRDGKSWQRVPSRGDLGGHGDQMILGVTSTPVGLVAVGRVTHTDGEIDGAVWTSVDGTTWELQTSRAYALPGSEQQIKWVVADEGHLIAGGWVGRPGRDLDAAVWRARLPHPE
ncbi:MAG: hypothetical protein M3516_07910 [Actinomycetota bacterium]|nr:hypothetical protein [Actinomycetota bacterium]